MPANIRSFVELNNKSILYGLLLIGITILIDDFGEAVMLKLPVYENTASIRQLGIAIILASMMGSFASLSGRFAGKYLALYCVGIVTAIAQLIYYGGNLFFTFNSKIIMGEEIGQLFVLYNFSSEARNMIDFIQQSWECCGVGGPSDWHSNLFGANESDDLPDSCCSRGFYGPKCGASLLKNPIDLRYSKVGCMEVLRAKIGDPVWFLTYIVYETVLNLFQSLHVAMDFVIMDEVEENPNHA